MCFLLLDEPGKPGNAEVVDWDVDHADITWTKPENDGGSPITGYVIEYKVSIYLISLSCLCGQKISTEPEFLIKLDVCDTALQKL